MGMDQTLRPHGDRVVNDDLGVVHCYKVPIHEGCRWTS
jgi:hypothetical protein